MGLTFLKSILVTLRLLSSDPEGLVALIDAQLKVCEEQEKSSRSDIAEHPRSNSFSRKPTSAREPLAPPALMVEGIGLSAGEVAFVAKNALLLEGKERGKNDYKERDPLYRHPNRASFHKKEHITVENDTEADKKKMQEILKEETKDDLLLFRKQIVSVKAKEKFQQASLAIIQRGRKGKLGY